MKFTTPSLLFALLGALSAVWSALALPVIPRDIINPPIISPKAGDAFTAGQTFTVTWDTSRIPLGIPNKGMLVLGFLTANSENLDLNNPLAANFLLTDGSHEITLPDELMERDNYIITLFGDSGNISQQFTIHEQNFLRSSNVNA